jgi:hypothetical protein
MTPTRNNPVGASTNPSAIGLIVALAALGVAAEAPRERNAADCGSPLAKYDSNRELGLGEAKPEEPDQPLRRYLYVNMKDSSACPPIGAGDPRGIIVLDIDNGHRFVKLLPTKRTRLGLSVASCGVASRQSNSPRGPRA